MPRSTPNNPLSDPGISDAFRTREKPPELPTLRGVVRFVCTAININNNKMLARAKMWNGRFASVNVPTVAKGEFLIRTLGQRAVNKDIYATFVQGGIDNLTYNAAPEGEPAILLPVHWLEVAEVVNGSGRYKVLQLLDDKGTKGYDYVRFAAVPPPSDPPPGISGSVSISGGSGADRTALTPTAVMTGDYFASFFDCVLCDPRAGGFTITLPPYSGKGMQIVIKNTTDSANEIVIANPTGLIDGEAAGISMAAPYGVTSLISDDPNWWIVGAS